MSAKLPAKRPLLLGLLLAMITASPAHAGEADVIGAEIKQTGLDSYQVSATIQHADTGWDHYADGFEIVSPDGTVLATRELLHPHVEEQPFTRSATSVPIPPGIDTVTIRAHDKVHGYGGTTVELAVPR